MKRTQGKRLLSLLLALVMVLGMLPATALAADATEPTETRTTTSADVKPTDAPCEGYEWVLQDETGNPTLTCDGHSHEDDCYALTCGHDYGHTAACYEGGEPGKWVVCNGNENEKNCDCYVTGNIKGYKYAIHKGMDVEKWCEAMGGVFNNDLVKSGIEKLVGYANIPTCADCTNQFALRVLVNRLGENVPDNYSWVEEAWTVATGDGVSAIDYVHYEPGEGAVSNCDHKCSDDCKELVCDGHHTDACYTTYYTWTQEKKTYTVTFDSNGGSDVTTPVTVDYGDTVREPSTTKNGFTFLGWYNGATKFDFATEIKQNYDLVAQWMPVAPTKAEVVDLLGNYQVVVDCTNSDVEHGDGKYGIIESCITVGNVTDGTNGYVVTVTLNANAYATHYGNGHTTEDEDVTLTLVYGDSGWALQDGTANSTTFEVNCVTPTVTVTFDSNGGSAVSAQTVKIGGRAEEPTGVTKTDYSLDGWYTNEGVKWNFASDTVGDSNITLTAKWTLAKPSVDQVFDVLGNDFKVKVACGNTEMNHSAAEYALDKSTITVGAVDTTNNTVVVTIAPDTYVAQYITGHSGAVAQTVTLTHTANGWQVNTTSVTFNVTCDTTYTVTFNANGGTGTMTAQTFTKGQAQTLTANAFSKSGYSFAGWNTQADGKGTAYADRASLTNPGNITLYAQWIVDGNGNYVPDEDETITVSVTGNGTVKLNGTEVKDGGSYVYDSTANDKTITVTTDPADGNYLVSVKVDGEDYTAPFTATGKHTVAVVFAEMSISAKDGEMNYYVGMPEMDSATLISEIKEATEEDATPDSIESGVVTEYLAADYGTYDLGGTTYELKYWAVPGTVVSPEAYLEAFLDKYDFGYLEGIAKAAVENILSSFKAPHAFGDQTTETVRYTYVDGSATIEKIVTVTLKDLREETEIVIDADVLANGVEVVYNSYTNESLLALIKPVITDANGDPVVGTVTIETEIVGKNVGTYEVELAYAGNATYKPGTGTVTVTVVKAPVTVDVKSQTVKYGQGYTYADPISTDPTDVKTIDFVVGLDAHDETDLTYVAQVVLPIDSGVVNWLKGLGVDLSATMSLSDLKTVLGYLVEINDYIDKNQLLEAVLGDYAIDTDTVTTLVNALTAVIEYLPEGADLEIQVTTALELPEDVGLYLVGAVTADPNYQTAFDVGYLVITPNGIKVDLEWSYVDENGILTIPAFSAGNFDLSAKGTVVDSTVEGANHPDKPEDHINYLFIGVNKDGELILSDKLALESKAGVYMEVAYLTNWDNEMYYAVPIARTLLLAPALADVTFIDENGNENYARVFPYDGKSKSMNAQVTVNGTVVADPGTDLTVTYVGIDGHAEGYNSTTAPTEAGVYAVVAVYTDYNDGELYTAGSAVGVMVIEKAADDSFKLEDAYHCYDGEQHFADVTNPKVFDYISIAINRDTNTAYVMLPDDLGEHIGDLPADVRTKVNELVSKLDGEVSSKEVIETINAAIDELIALDMVGEAEGLLDDLLAEVEDLVDVDALKKQIETEIDALKKAVKAELPDEMEALLKEIVSNAGEVNVETVKAQLLAEIAKLDLPEEVVDELKALVTDLANKVGSNEDVIALTAQIEEVVAKLSAYEIPETNEIVKAIVGVMAGAVSQTELDEILVEVIAKIEARGYAEDAKAMIKNIASIYNPKMDTSELEDAIDAMVAKIKNKAASGKLDADDLENFEAAIDNILAELKGVVSQLPNGTIIFGEYPTEIGEYDCYAITLAANYKSVFAQATLIIADHIWDEGKVTTEPTCAEEGVMTYTCEKCGATKTEAIDALGHSYEAVVTEPTCTEDGYTTYTCSVCGDTYTDDAVDALGHTPGEEVQENYVAPTYTRKGSYDLVVYCTVCGEELSRETIEIDKLIYPYYPPVVSDPTVTVKGLNTVDHVAYIVGTGDNKVSPLGTITRAEVATIYFRLMTDEFRTQFWSDTNSYSDVADTAWYNVAVSTLENAGVITDTAEGGEFRPNDPITRAELSVMAAQFCTLTGKIPETSFQDVAKDHWAYEEIKLIEYAGWIEGFEGYFRPDDNLTRAECMTIINRMLQRGAEAENMLEDMVTFVDNIYGTWYYEAVQEAANSHTYTRTAQKLTDEDFHGEKWTALVAAPDWAALEKAWSEGNDN